MKLPGCTWNFVFLLNRSLPQPVRKVRELSLFPSYVYLKWNHMFREDLNSLNPRGQPSTSAWDVPKDPHWGTRDPAGKQPDGERVWQGMHSWSLSCSPGALRSLMPICVSWALVASHILMFLIQPNKWRKREPKMAEVLGDQGMKTYTFYEIRWCRVSWSFKWSHTRMGLGELVSREECSAREGSHPLCPVASAVPNICDPGLHGSRHHRQSEGAPKCCPEVSCWRGKWHWADSFCLREFLSLLWRGKAS